MSETGGTRSSGEVGPDHGRALLRIAGRLARVGGWAIELPDERLYWSPEMNEILGFPPDRQPSLDEALDLYPSDDRARILAALDACREHGTPFDLEVRSRTATGDLVWVRAVGEAERSPDGNLIMRGALQDITHRKASEQRTRALADRLSATIESISDALFTVDRGWRFTHVNGRAEEILEVDREVLLGRNLWEVFSPAIGTTFYEAYHRAVSDGVPTTVTDYYPPLGRWIEVNAHPFSDGLTVQFRDVSEQRERERSLQRLASSEQRAADRLRQLDQSKNAFLSAVSHELRTPLTVVHGMADTLRTHGSDLDPAQRMKVEEALYKHTERLRTLLDDLLDVDRLSAGALSARRASFDAAELVRSLVTRTGLAPRTDVDAPPTLPVHADQPKVERLVGNLLENVAKYAPDGRVIVRARRLGGEGVRIEVEDDGPGIADDDAEHVFEPFYRADRDHPTPGTGVGLSLVAEFALLHGGGAWVEPPLRLSGTNLVVEIPGAGVDEPA